MLFSDVNILVHAIRPRVAPDGVAVRGWLLNALQGRESVCISEFVLSSMTRIVTQARLYTDPATAHECMEFAEALLGAPNVQVLRPGPRHWSIFSEIVTTHRLRGNDVPDAYLASLAMEQGATFVTLDPGFARFEGLRTLNPLAA